MPEYILQKHLPGNDYGEWSDGETFSAGNDEEAKRQALEVIARTRLYYGESRVRILKVMFEGLPRETGYQLPHNEQYENLVAGQTALMADLLLKLKSQTLDDFKDIRFVLQTVPQVLDGRGYDLRLLYSAGYGFMGSASKEEVEHARGQARLTPGDVTVSAYYIQGPEGSQCVSVSKVVSFEEDGKTPKECIHLWPLEFSNLAIDPAKLKNKEIEDERTPIGNPR